MKSKFVKISILLLILTMIMVPSAAAKTANNATIDVIILSNRSTNALVKGIESLGGSVTYRYKNVTAVAATIPAKKLGQVATISGVTSVQKDEIVYLTDELEGGKNDQNPMSYVVEDMAGVEVQALDPMSFDLGRLPEGYANFLYTGALEVWEETSEGEGTIVAVVDTGTFPNTCLDQAVIGAPGFPNGYNAIDDAIPATSPLNHWHGTVVGGVIASVCALNFSAAPTHPIYLAQAPFLNWPVNFVPIFGQAPGAQLYPVKVFPADGSGSLTSVILDGLDHILSLKNEDLLDIDIVNMSLGGPTLWDGRDAYDRFIEVLAETGILVVTSAGNEGPIPNSVGSPGTSFGAVSVGAVDYAPSSRTLYEYLGLAVWPGAPGQGMVMRPTDETRVVNYSARGPLGDGRFGPEITALGHWNFHQGTQGEVRWVGGTSFASPTVAGGAALLNAWWEAEGYETDPEILENVLFLGADPDVVGTPWQDINNQGYGALDIPSSLEFLMEGDWKLKPAKKVGELTANMLGKPVKDQVQTWESESITLDPSVPFDAVFEIGEYTNKVTIEVYDIVIPDNYDYAYWANALEVHLQSAKRTDFAHPIAVYWYPWYGESFDIVVEDGPWTFWDEPWTYQPMEPGLMKLSLIPDYSNESPVSFKVRITRENFKEPLSVKNRIGNGVIKMADSYVVPVEIPEGTTMATFDLVWNRDWASFPTSDIDLYIYDPDGYLYSVDGATANAPERAILFEPMAGTWYVEVYGYEVNKSDNFDLFLTLE